MAMMIRSFIGKRYSATPSPLPKSTFSFLVIVQIVQSPISYFRLPRNAAPQTGFVSLVESVSFFLTVLSTPHPHFVLPGPKTLSYCTPCTVWFKNIGPPVALCQVPIRISSLFRKLGTLKRVKLSSQLFQVLSEKSEASRNFVAHSSLGKGGTTLVKHCINSILYHKVDVLVNNN